MSGPQLVYMDGHTYLRLDDRAPLIEAEPGWLVDAGSTCAFLAERTYSDEYHGGDLHLVSSEATVRVEANNQRVRVFRIERLPGGQTFSSRMLTAPYSPDRPLLTAEAKAEYDDLLRAARATGQQGVVDGAELHFGAGGSVRVSFPLDVAVALVRSTAAAIDPREENSHRVHVREVDERGFID